MRTTRQVLELWLDAYNMRDAHALAALYHEHAENHQVAFGSPLRGRAALLESFVSFFRAFPDSQTQPENILVDGDHGAIEWLGTGTFMGAMGGHAPTGKSFALRGCGFFRVEGGKIAFQRGYIDRQSWFEQIGLHPS